MAPQQWSEGTSRHKWLHNRGPAYQKAIHAKTKVAFLEKLFHDWFEIYHWSLDNKTEADSKAVYLEPILESDILLKNKIIVAKKDVRCTLIFRDMIFSSIHYTQALTRWFAHRYDDSNVEKSPKTVGPSPFPVVGSVASHTPAKKGIAGNLKPKISQAVHVFSSMYFMTKVKPLVKARWERDQGKLTAGGKAFTSVASSALLTKEVWESSPAHIKEAVEKERQIRYQTVLAKYNLEIEKAASITPQDFQTYVISIFYLSRHLLIISTVLSNMFIPICRMWRRL
jgi:hypothetical protein